MEANYQTNLSINDYLFDEILVNIFTYLNGGQLRICREVCNKWNDLLKADKFLAQWQCLHIKRISGEIKLIFTWIWLSWCCSLELLPLNWVYVGPLGEREGLS
uniref:CSON006253 protein n=1 Tax=Culicoides sonorensis TaxID=179676 RepID=A0A336LJJ2_CULSO